METFITLKKSIVQIQNSKPDLEQKNDDITELLQALNSFGIEIQDYDYKLLNEKDNLFVEFAKKLDGSLYFVESNIQKYRHELKQNIKSFNKEIKKAQEELNVEILNKYKEESYSALFFIEDKSISIKKLEERSKYYQRQEYDIESDEHSQFQNLDELTYEYDLKSK